MNTEDLEGDRQDREKERRKKYSLVILVMSNKAYHKSPFYQAHVNTTCLPFPLKTHPIWQHCSLSASFFLLSSSSSCWCLTVPSVQRKKHGRLKVFFFSLFCSLSLISSLLRTFQCLFSVISVFFFLSLSSSSCQCYDELSHPTCSGMS